MSYTDDLGLSPEFADPNNFIDDNESVTPQGNKSCVCGREVVRFDVYRTPYICQCEGPNETYPRGFYCGHDGVSETVGGIVGVVADGSTCCSAFEHYGPEESARLASEFNARECVALSQEL